MSVREKVAYVKLVRGTSCCQRNGWSGFMTDESGDVTMLQPFRICQKLRLKRLKIRTHTRRWTAAAPEYVAVQWRRREIDSSTERMLC